MAGSFWRTAPAAALRGLAKVASPGFFQPAVEPLELGARHEDLAADLEVLDLGQRAAQHHGQAADRLEVGGDVLADAAVTAGGAAHEAAARVEQRHAQAVDLRLADVGEALAGQHPADARLELAQIVGAGGVVEREHRDAVLDRLKGLDRRPRHPLGRAVGGDQVGELRLQGLELPHERVVLRVRDLGTRLDVVEVVVVVNALAQLSDPLRGIGRRHAAQHSTGPRRLGARRERSAGAAC